MGVFNSTVHQYFQQQGDSVSQEVVDSHVEAARTLWQQFRTNDVERGRRCLEYLPNSVNHFATFFAATHGMFYERGIRARVGTTEPRYPQCCSMRCFQMSGVQEENQLNGFPDPAKAGYVHTYGRYDDHDSLHWCRT